MFNATRRNFLAGIGAATTSALLPAFAQQAITEEQRRDYARIFAANPGANLATNKELLILRDLQQNRLAFPSSLRTLEEFIDGSPAMAAMHAGQTPQLGMLLLWNGFALDATSVDHTTQSGDDPPATYGEQLGPARSSRGLAIVHLAMFEAINAIYRTFKSYRDIQKTLIAHIGLPAAQISPATASVARAITEAAFDCLVSLYPNQRGIFDIERTKALATIGDSAACQAVGERIGHEAASLVLLDRQHDRSRLPDLTASDFTSPEPLDWNQDPISMAKPALGGNWGRVRPFVVSSSEKYRPVPPPAAESAEFMQAFKAVKKLGGDPNAPTVAPRWPTQTTRTGSDNSHPIPLDAHNDTFKGLFWAYDGTPLLCAPPRLYNMVALSIALKEKPIAKVEEMARFLALINITLADAGICAWEAKYHYAFARPITAIRSLDADTSPDGARDPNWTPLGAPVSNGKDSQRNLTPPFPAYPSGHATFGGALFETLRLYWGLRKDGIAFDFVSDEYNGLNRGPGDPYPRPHVERHFKSFTEAELENAQSRVWLGIHWQFDAYRGIEQGHLVAREVLANILGPV